MNTCQMKTKAGTLSWSGREKGCLGQSVLERLEGLGEALSTKVA